MHAQAQPERPKGEGHGWPEFYSPRMRPQGHGDSEFSLSRIPTAQTLCLAPTISRPGHLRSEPLVLRIPGAFRDNLCGVALAKYLDFHLAALGGEVRV